MPWMLVDYLTVCRQVTESELMNWKYKLLLLVWPWIFGLFMALVNIIIDGGGSVLTDTWFCEAWAGSWAFSFTVALIGLGLLIILFSMGSLIRVRERKSLVILLYSILCWQFCLHGPSHRLYILQRKEWIDFASEYMFYYQSCLVFVTMINWSSFKTYTI